MYSYINAYIAHWIRIVYGRTGTKLRFYCVYTEAVQSNIDQNLTITIQ